MSDRQEKRRAKREENKITQTLPHRYEKYSKKDNLTQADIRRLREEIMPAYIAEVLLRGNKRSEET